MTVPPNTVPALGKAYELVMLPELASEPMVLAGPALTMTDRLSMPSLAPDISPLLSIRLVFVPPLLVSWMAVPLRRY